MFRPTAAFLVGNHELLAHNEGWCDALDALARRNAKRAKPQVLIDEVARLGINPGQLHAHHIVMKGADYASSIEARALLTKYGIDTLDGTSAAAKATGYTDPARRIQALAEAGDNLDNMAWAINSKGYYGEHGLHSEVAQNAVLKYLKKAEQSGRTYAEKQAKVKDALA